MKALGEILAELSKGGFRITRARRSMIEVLLDSRLPLSAEGLIDALLGKKVPANKTTVYRELTFLKEMGIVQEIQFLHERVKRYEVVFGGHHHHLICMGCKRVEDVELEGELEKYEREIMNSRGFKVLNHTLEFMGLCEDCR
ncbi:MAG: transcriptional repressor [Deltaproteobacteria bacterium]|nr:transcriptional repressor [Deltaproteobacteria bacterium]